MIKVKVAYHLILVDKRNFEKDHLKKGFWNNGSKSYLVLS